MPAGQPNLSNCIEDTKDEVIAWRKNTGNVSLRRETLRIISIIKEWQSAGRGWRIMPREHAVMYAPMGQEDSQSCPIRNESEAAGESD